MLHLVISPSAASIVITIYVQVYYHLDSLYSKEVVHVLDMKLFMNVQLLVEEQLCGKEALLTAEVEQIPYLCAIVSLVILNQLLEFAMVNQSRHKEYHHLTIAMFLNSMSRSVKAYLVRLYNVLMMMAE